jgi:hypothetical protein
MRLRLRPRIQAQHRIHHRGTFLRHAHRLLMDSIVPTFMFHLLQQNSKSLLHLRCCTRQYQGAAIQARRTFIHR